MKEYMAPEMEVVELKVQGMLAASPAMDDGGADVTNPDMPERE